MGATRSLSHRRIAASIVALALSTAPSMAAHGQVEPFALGPATAAPGTSAIGELAVLAGVDPGTTIPFTLLHGARPGPVLALIAGVHGSEYAPILALRALSPKVDPAGLAGTVILIHVANVPSFFGRTVYYGPDGKNLNRLFPGRPDGTVTERIAHVLTTQVIDRADAVVDLHSGDGNEALAPYVGYVADAPVSERSRRLALAFGFDTVIASRGRSKDPAAAVYCSNAAVTRGKPAVAVESGQLGRPDPADVDRIVRGVRGAMAHLGRIEPATDPARAPPRLVGRTEVLRSPAAGLFEPAVDRGAEVAAGDPIGRVTDVFGAVLHEAKAPFAGVVYYVLATPPVGRDEPLAMIGAPEAPPPVYLNHLFLVVDAETYESIGRSPFLADVFATRDGGITRADHGALWPAHFLRGRSTYIEIFEPRSLQGTREGWAGLGFGVERAGGIRAVHDRLVAGGGARNQHLDLRRLGADGREIPWFWYSVRGEKDVETPLALWAMEYHEAMLDRRGLTIPPDGVVPRSAYLGKLVETIRGGPAPDDRLLGDVVGVTLALPEAEARELDETARSFDYAVAREASARRYKGHEIALEVRPAASSPRGYRITGLTLSLRRDPPADVPREHRFGPRSRLVLRDNRTAEWTFDAP